MNNPPINWASIEAGAFSTTDCVEDVGDSANRDLPLYAHAVDPEGQVRYLRISAANMYTIHLLHSVLLNTFIVRVWYSDGRHYTFHNFETSVDGVTWTEVIPAGSERRQTFKERFPDRMVQMIRLRASNSVNPCFHLIRFQAFYVPDNAVEFTGPATANAIPVASPVSGK